MSPRQAAITQLGSAFHTLRGDIDPGDLSFRPRVVGVVEIKKDFCPGDGSLFSPGAAGPRLRPEGQLSPRAGSMSPSLSEISQWGWGFNTLRGGIDPGDLRFRLRVVRVVDIWKRFWSGDETLSSPGMTGPRRCPETQLSPRAGSVSPSQSATSQLGWGFHTLWGGFVPGDLRFRPRVVGFLELWTDF